MIRHARSLSVVFGAAVAAGVLHLACSTNVREPPFEPESNQPGFGSEGGLDGGGDGSCLSEALAAQPVPLAMLLVMDRSGSMLAPAGNTKWDQARNAMVGFADTPGVAGAKLGLSIFPPDRSSGLPECHPESYKPIVPIALLPGNAIAIKQALSIREAADGTPMGAALQGGLDVMTEYLQKNPDEEGIVILVTDGDPSNCGSVNDVAKTAENGANATPSIRTFAVGMEGATFSNLDVIAKAGKGTPTAFNTSVTDGGISTQQQLIDALTQIRSGALGCEYLVPKPDPSKGIVDPESVTIDFLPGRNDPKQTLRRVSGPEACGETTGGFYYDNPERPTRIILCPASCDAVRKGDEVSKLDVVLGCIVRPH